MTDTPDDIIATFGVNPFEIVNRHRAHWIVEKPDEDEIQYNVEPGWLAIRARDGAGNPISVEATRRPNFMATYEDDFDSTYRYYYFAPLPPTSAENARVAQEPVAWAERRELDRVKPGAARGCLPAKTPLIGDGWNFNVPLFTQDQLDAAVRAERERCARIADGEAERHRLNYRAGRLVLDLYYETSALNVAAAIREGE